MSKRGKRYKSFKDSVKKDLYSINDAIKTIKENPLLSEFVFKFPILTM